MKVDPCWCLMPSSAFVFYLTPGFVMFELRRTLLFEKNLVWIQIRKRKNRILVEKGWTVLCFSHLLFWAGSWIPFWEGHFLMQKPEFVAFFWCLLCFLSMNYSLIFKGCWKLLKKKKPELIVFRRFKSGLECFAFQFLLVRIQLLNLTLCGNLLSDPCHLECKNSIHKHKIET